MRKIILLLLVLLCFSISYSQIKRSEKLVVISGEKYYLHRVEPHQTMYSLSKAYAVSISNILEANHKETTDLQQGELLKIPYAEPATVVQSMKYKHYIVKKGDTLYSLAMKFKTTEQELITLNAGVEVALVEGRRLIVPIVLENQPRYDSSYYYHIVKKKETLSAIARRYGMSLGKLKRLNDKVSPNRLKPNDEVRIPIDNARAEVAAIRMINRKTKEQNEVLVEKDASEKYQGTLTKIPEGWVPPLFEEDSLAQEQEELLSYEPEFKDSYEMAIFLPLKNSFSGMLNYYKGMLLAAEENGDIPVNIQVYDSRRNRSVVQSHLRKHKKPDFIVGPYMQNVFPAVLPFADGGTTVVSLLSKNEAVYTNKNVLQINTTERSINHKIAEYVVNEHINDNVILFNGYTFVNYSDTAKLSSDKIKRLAYLINTAQDKGGKSVKNYQQEFEKLLNTDKKNIVIVPESNYKLVNQILNALNVFSMNDIEVIGYYKWKLLPMIDPNMLFNLNVTYFTPFHYLPSEQKAFVNSYKEKFNAFPDDFSYMGYETMHKLLTGIRAGGRNFYKKPLQRILKHKGGGYENINLHKVQFRKDYEIIAE